jgi:uncharacterized membrane protein required for colicin V production
VKFNWVDAVILLIVARGMYVGYKTGLSQEFFRFLALIAAYYSALMLHADVARFIAAHSLITEKWALLISFIGVAVFFFVLVIVLFKLLQKWVRLEFVNNLNVYGGALAGGLRGLIIVSLILFALFFIPDQFVKRQIYSNSLLGYYAIEYTPNLYARLSKWISAQDLSGRKMYERFEREKRKLIERKPARRVDSVEKILHEPETEDGINEAQDEAAGESGEQDILPEEIKDEELVNRTAE